MEETNTQPNTEAPVAAAPAPKAAPTSYAQNRRAPQSRGGSFGGGRPGGKGGARRPGGRGDKPRSEFDQKTLVVRRVTRVTSGGRRFAFSVAVVTGNKKGSVGVGIGKAGDTSLAIQKALADAKKSMITLNLNKMHSIPAQTEAKNSSARVMLFPNAGRGLVAGSSVRVVLELAGVKNVTAKVLSPSKNKLNIARAALQALTVFGKKYGTAVVAPVEAAKDDTITSA